MATVHHVCNDAPKRTQRQSHALRAKLILCRFYAHFPLSDCFVDMRNLSRRVYIKKVRKKRIKRFTGLAQGHIINRQLRRIRTIVRFTFFNCARVKQFFPAAPGDFQSKRWRAQIKNKGAGV
ncbi:MAG: hypothetical protein KDA46_10820 [Parvularculaceae bacterium]|nr:hypothetical protein [Parvularculaceae bacterium]